MRAVKYGKAIALNGFKKKYTVSTVAFEPATSQTTTLTFDPLGLAVILISLL